MIDDPNPAQGWDDRLQDLQSFGHELGGQARHSGEVSPWLRHCRHNAGGHGVAHPHEHNGDGLGGHLDRLGGLFPDRKDKVHARFGEGRGSSRSCPRIAPGESDIEGQITALLETDCLEPRPEALHRRVISKIALVKDPNPVRALSVLRLRYEGRGKQAKGKSDDQPRVSVRHAGTLSRTMARKGALRAAPDVTRARSRRAWRRRR